LPLLIIISPLDCFTPALHIFLMMSPFHYLIIDFHAVRRFRLMLIARRFACAFRLLSAFITRLRATF